MSLDRQLEDLARRAVDSADVPGLAIAIVDRHGLRHVSGHGWRQVGRPEGYGPDTVGWWAGLTQPLTCLLALQLVEQGRLTLDDPAQQWLPALGEVRVLAGYVAGRPQLRRPVRPITLRQLMTHTAGFGSELWHPELLRFQELSGTPGWQSCRPEALQMPLLFDPGERWCLGIGVDWVGRLVEAVEASSLEEVFAHQIAGPLGLTDTGFRLRAAMRERLARLHQRSSEGWVPLDLEIGQSSGALAMGGAGLYGSVTDLARCLQLWLNDARVGHQALLRPSSLDLMCQNAIGDLRVQPMRSALPALTQDLEFYPGLEKSWTLALMRNDQRTPGGRPAGGLMWGGLPNLAAFIDRRAGLAGLMMVQTLPGGDPRAQALFGEIERIVYQSLQ